MYFMVSYLISIYLSLIGYLPLWVCLRPRNLVFLNYFFQFFSFSVYTSVNKWYVLYSSYIKLNPGFSLKNVSKNSKFLFISSCTIFTQSLLIHIYIYGLNSWRILIVVNIKPFDAAHLGMLYNICCRAYFIYSIIKRNNTLTILNYCFFVIAVIPPWIVFDL